MPLRLDIPALHDFLDREFPQVRGKFRVERLQDEQIVIRMPVTDGNLRPGGTVSGPTVFSLADVAVYLIAIAHIGPKALAVTTSGSIDFMRKPAAGADLIGKCRLLKLGRVLVVGDVLIYSDGDDRPVARASMTYSIPPR